MELKSERRGRKAAAALVLRLGPLQDQCETLPAPQFN